MTNEPFDYWPGLPSCVRGMTVHDPKDVSGLQLSWGSNEPIDVQPVKVHLPYEFCSHLMLAPRRDGDPDAQYLVACLVEEAFKSDALRKCHGHETAWDEFYGGSVSAAERYLKQIKRSTSPVMHFLFCPPQWVHYRGVGDSHSVVYAPIRSRTDPRGTDFDPGDGAAVWVYLPTARIECLNRLAGVLNLPLGDVVVGAAAIDAFRYADDEQHVEAFFDRAIHAFDDYVTEYAMLLKAAARIVRAGVPVGCFDA